ncbi:MAG: SDR family oxidoreductase [Candidatus Binataceae bacterium]|nr:SDR family oxidoreductase [Candidatus Binataceae bacterium]
MTAKVAIVTGAGSGIGQQTTIALLNQGYCVAMAGRHIESLESTEAAARAHAERTLLVVTDIRNPAAVRNLFVKTREKFGRLDLLFNNAGTSAPGVPMEDLTYGQWQSVIEVNLTGTFLCTQEAFRVMKNQDPRGGRIINNGSVSAHVPRPDSAPYTATKHAITGLTRSTSLDGRKYGIACGQIDIGNAATEMTARMAVGMPQADGSVRAEPRMDADNVARAVVFMASLPLDANVQFMTVMATTMPFIGRG